MPSVSGKQHRFMEMVAHDPAAAKRVGVKPSVGRDFVQADKAEHKHFKGHAGKMESLKGRAKTSGEK
jgi:hypothetical protein